MRTNSSGAATAAAGATSAALARTPATAARTRARFTCRHYPAVAVSSQRRSPRATRRPASTPVSRAGAGRSLNTAIEPTARISDCQFSASPPRSRPSRRIPSQLDRLFVVLELVGVVGAPPGHRRREPGGEEDRPSSRSGASSSTATAGGRAPVPSAGESARACPPPAASRRTRDPSRRAAWTPASPAGRSQTVVHDIEGELEVLRLPVLHHLLPELRRRRRSARKRSVSDMWAIWLGVVPARDRRSPARRA